MGLGDILTEEEFSAYVPYQGIIHQLETYLEERNLRREEVNILDWGCGRGTDVLWLRKQGYINTFGVDICQDYIKLSSDFTQKKELDNSILSLIDSDCRTTFPDNFFHFTFSNQVFEHVENIEQLASELSRITKTGGVGYHVFPGHKYITEGHLYMPFIHWLPKNRLRKYLMYGYVLFGIEPKWQIENYAKKVDTYFNYSINKTYYRKYSDIRKIFLNRGFDVNFVTINHPKVQKNRFISKFANFYLTKPLVNYLLLTFKVQELFIKKI